jgi:hypothetical protein
MMGSPVSFRNDATYYLRYGATSRLDVGVGYWTDPGKARPAVNWQLVQARANRPALLVGYGSEPVGEWKDDGAYVSMVKPFGTGERPAQGFLAYFREIDGRTNHLIGGVLKPIGRNLSLFVGRYPFNSWDASVTFPVSSEVQMGVWVRDMAHSPRIGFSLGTGWRVKS